MGRDINRRESQEPRNPGINRRESGLAIPNGTEPELPLLFIGTPTE